MCERNRGRGYRGVRGRALPRRTSMRRKRGGEDDGIKGDEVAAVDLRNSANVSLLTLARAAQLSFETTLLASVV